MTYPTFDEAVAAEQQREAALEAALRAAVAALKRIAGSQYDVHGWQQGHLRPTPDALIAREALAAARKALE